MNLTGVSNYSAVVFDCADTLLRMNPSRAELFRDAATKVGVVLPLKDIERAYEIVDFAIKMKSSVIGSQEGKKLDFYYTINSALCNVLGIQRSVSVLHPRLLAEFGRRRQWCPFPDVIGTLSQISRWVPLYVLANWDSELPAVLRQTGLERFFHSVLSSEMLGREKPERGCFDEFLCRTSVDPANALYVGNEYLADVVGARNAGLTPVLVDRDGKMPSADCLRIANLAELTAVLHKPLVRSE